MALSVVTDLAIGDVITEAWVDAVRINSNDQKTFAEGTAPFVGSSQAFANDSAFKVAKSGTGPYLQFDSTDYLEYDRTNNSLRVIIGGSLVFSIDSSGRIQDALWESSEQTITNGSTANIAHGFSTTPRLWGGRYNTVTGDAGRTRVISDGYLAVASSARIEQVGGTNIVVINNTGATIYAKVWALR